MDITVPPTGPLVNAGRIADAPSKVTASIPAGDGVQAHSLWCLGRARGCPEKVGEQQIADLGIGFVQLIGERTAVTDMPNNGTGTYTGNWVATVRESGLWTAMGRYLACERGPRAWWRTSTDAEITATLMGLATLEGDIAGNDVLRDQGNRGSR